MQWNILIDVDPKWENCLGRQLPLKGGHHARTKKCVKRVVFHGRAMYARTVERVSKLPKFGKKGILFNSFDTRLGYIFYLFRVGKTWPNTCLGWEKSKDNYLFRVHFQCPCTSMVSTFQWQLPPRGKLALCTLPAGGAMSCESSVLRVDL